MELSVIIPTYNRAERLRSCLESLSQQTQPPTDFEVIVVDDGSTDDTQEMLANLATPYELRVYYQENKFHGAARNLGVGRATGRYLLHLDDDMVADPRLLAEHLRVQRERRGVVGLGHIVDRLPSGADGFARYIAKRLNNYYESLKKRQGPPSFEDFFSGNASMPRAAFERAGGFPVDLPRSVDMELAYRLERQGIPFVYNPEAISHQDYRNGFTEITRNAETRGVVSIDLYRRHPAMLPRMPLGAFGETSLRALLLRRALLALRFPIRPLALVGPLLGSGPRAHKWYEFLYSYCYWRGVQRAVPDRDTWHRLTRPPVILMYHAFGHPGERPSRYVVPAGRFAQQMGWLKRRRYNVLSLDECLRYRREHRLPPARSVVITFDDGYVDQYALAYPILRRFGFPATLFLVSGSVGATNHWSRGELAGRPLLSWQAIHEMLRGDISYGAHTRTHSALTSVPPMRARDEVEGSRVDLERDLGLPIRTFAYPYGEEDWRRQEIVRQAGFDGACGVERGFNSPATPVEALRRIGINGSDSLVRFALALRLGDTRVVSRLWNGT